MCKQCENNFLMEVIDTTSKESAIAQFQHSYITFHLPIDIEFLEERQLVGFWTYTQHLEEIEKRFLRELANREKPLNKLYVYTSELLKAHSVIVVLCIANRKGYACTNLNYIPGRIF